MTSHGREARLSRVRRPDKAGRARAAAATPPHRTTTMEPGGSTGRGTVIRGRCNLINLLIPVPTPCPATLASIRSGHDWGPVAAVVTFEAFW